MARDTTQLDPPPATAAPAGPTTPPAPRLRLAPGGAGRGIMDGGWWPRSRDTGAELIELLTALAGTGDTPGPATRVAIDFNDWDGVPLRITVLGQEVRVGWLAHLDHMVSITCGRADPILLLLIPPGAAPSAAEAALAGSAAGTGDAMPQEILASCGISTVRV